MAKPSHFGVALALALVPLAWLLPNHYPPWLSAWHEGFALACLAIAAILSRCGLRVARPWLSFAALAALSIAVQAAIGRVQFAGDALMAALYIGAFILAWALGDLAARGGEHAAGGTTPLRTDGVAIFAFGVLVAALLSLATALAQWTGVSIAPGWIVDLPPRERPFSNLAQPNHFNTALFLGLAASGVLYEGRRIGPFGFWAAAASLLLGMAASGSRSAWLQLSIAALLIPWAARRGGRPAATASRLAAALIGLYAAWLPVTAGIGELLGRSSRPAGDMLSSGTRPAVWRDMLTAATREPLLGHGWLQSGAAQQSAAMTRSSYFEHTEHAHNIVLDLVVWTGIPVGAALTILASAAVLSTLRRLRDGRAAWLMAGALGLIAHGMLEYPLEYAYFLVPLGVSLGMVDAMSAPPGPPSHQRAAGPRWIGPAGGALLAGLLAVITVDYLRAEEDFRIARLQSARIGTDRVSPEIPDLLVLTQLETMLRFVRTEAKPGLSPADLDWMHAVSMRYGWPPVLFRYALALGLNGRPEEAAHSLKLICQIHAARHCDEARTAWADMQARQPELRAVPLP